MPSHPLIHYSSMKPIETNLTFGINKLLILINIWWSIVCEAGYITSHITILSRSACCKLPSHLAFVSCFHNIIISIVIVMYARWFSALSWQRDLKRRFLYALQNIFFWYGNFYYFFLVPASSCEFVYVCVCVWALRHLVMKLPLS